MERRISRLPAANASSGGGSSFRALSGWVGFWDADMATPLSEVARFLVYASLHDGRVDGIFGSRIHRLGSAITRDYVRHLAGRIFATMVDGLFDIGCYDSQCGAKLFRTDLIDRAFSEPFVSRWIFDVEIILRLQSCNLIEYPLQQWTDVPGGTVKMGRLVGPTVADLIRIRTHYRRKLKTRSPDGACHPPPRL